MEREIEDTPELEFAAQALDAYLEYPHYTKETALCDLLTALMLYSRKYDLDFTRALNEGGKFFRKQVDSIERIGKRGKDGK